MQYNTASNASEMIHSISTDWDNLELNIKNYLVKDVFISFAAELSYFRKYVQIEAICINWGRKYIISKTKQIDCLTVSCII